MKNSLPIKYSKLPHGFQSNFRKRGESQVDDTRATDSFV